MTSEGSQVVLEVLKFGEVDGNVRVSLSTDGGTATGWHNSNNNYMIIIMPFLSRTYGFHTKITDTRLSY